MRFVFNLLACLMMVVTVWSSAQAAEPRCSDTIDQVALHVAGDCDEVPADADRNYPHCHTGCHGHHVATPVPAHASVRIVEAASAYAPAGSATLTAHRPKRTLRPPQA